MIEKLFSTFTDATVYFVMASISTAIFVLRILLMSLFGLGDGAADHPGDAGHAHHGDSGDSFHVFSTLSITAFMMGAGWMGLTCRMEWELGKVASAFAAVGFGAAMMLLTSYLLFSMQKLNASGNYNVRHCVGATGRVYLRIPGKGEGTGQVEVDVDGRRKVLPAASTSAPIDSFVTVRVVDVSDNHTLIVERV